MDREIEIERERDRERKAIIMNNPSLKLAWLGMSLA